MTKFFVFFIITFVLTALVLTLVAFQFLGVEILYDKIPGFVVLAPILIAVSYLYRQRDINISNASLVIFLGALFTNMHILPMFAIARLRGPLKDNFLAGIDKSIGFEVKDLLLINSSYESQFFLFAYDTLMIILISAMLIPALLGQAAKTREFLIALIFSTTAGFVLFYFFQAEGPWNYYGYQPSVNQNEFDAMYRRVRNDSVFFLDPSYSKGLICFPSFHTILAILSAFALSEVPYLRIIFAMDAILIIVSTVLTGTHYVIDSLVGIFIGLVSVYFANRVNRTLS